jgi:putative addiction module component (TIGR02574 family)
MSEQIIPNPPGFTNLSKADQIRYVQRLWDQISKNPDEIPVPESHLQLVESRLRRMRSNRPRSRSAFEILDELTEKYK